MSKHKFNIGDKIRIKNYGHLIFVSKHMYAESRNMMENAMAKIEAELYFPEDKHLFKEKPVDPNVQPSNIVWQDTKMWYCDIQPNLVGKVAIVSEVIMTQGIPSYSLMFGRQIGSRAWFNENQMKLIKANTNKLPDTKSRRRAR